MQNNDDRILALQNLIDQMQVDIPKFTPNTNCLLILNDKNYNLHALDINNTKLLILRLNMYKMSMNSLTTQKDFENLGLDEIKICGYDIDDWIDDLKQKLNILISKEKIKEIKQKKDELSKLLSNDKQTELRIDNIEEQLKKILK